jgi:hypothetical protein
MEHEIAYDDEIEDIVEQLLCAIDREQRSLTGAFSLLAQNPAVDQDTENLAASLQNRRDELLKKLGLRIFQHWAAGGTLLLQEVDIPEPEPEAAAAVELASSESLRVLESRGLGVQFSTPGERLAGALTQLQSMFPPLEIPTKQTASETLRALLSVDLRVLCDLPTSSHLSALGLLATWGQALQEVLGDHDSMKRLFGRLTEHSERERPGFVFGLARGHRPAHGSWMADARRHHHALFPTIEVITSPEVGLRELAVALQKSGDIRPAVLRSLESVDASDPRLVKLLSGRLAALDEAPRLKAVRKAIRQSHRAADREREPRIDWPHRDKTAGKRVMLIGGDGRTQMAAQLEEVFGFATVKWVAGRKMRRIQNIEQQVRSGSVDLCLLLDHYVSHKATEKLIPSCQEHRVPIIMIGGGKGMTRTRDGLLRLLCGSEE